MSVWARINVYSSVWTTGLVTLAHAGVLFWVVSQRVGEPASPDLETLEIVFAEVLPLPEPEPEPVPVIFPKPDQSVAPAPSSKSVLTQLDSDRAATVQPSAPDPQTPAEATMSVAPNALAAVLQRAHCRRLSHKVDDDCPKTDPFAIAEASMSRQSAAPTPAQLNGDYGPKSRLEGFFSQRDQDPYLMPGMDGDLFTPGMAPGAYDAQRIRNGKAPLWSKEMTDGFTKSD